MAEIIEIRRVARCSFIYVWVGEYDTWRGVPEHTPALPYSRLPELRVNIADQLLHNVYRDTAETHDMRCVLGTFAAPNTFCAMVAGGVAW